MAGTWSIARRAGACAVTGRPFEDGESHVSLLRVNEGALERVDLCREAWREERARIEVDDAEEPLFFWTTRHEVDRKKTVQLDFESLAALFVGLEGREEREVRELRYVLCLLLMRKRRVKVEKVVRKGDEESFIVKRPRDDTRYVVYVYDFEPERLDELRAQLQAVFDGAEGPCGVRLDLGGDDDLAVAEDGADAAADASADSAPDPAGGDVGNDADEPAA